MDRLEKAIQAALVFLQDGRTHKLCVAENGGHPQALLCVGLGWLVGIGGARYLGGDEYKLNTRGQSEILKRLEHGDIQVGKGLHHGRIIETV